MNKKRIALAAISMVAILGVSIALGLVQVQFGGTFGISITPPPTEGLSISLTSRAFGTISPGSITITPVTLSNTGNTALTLNYNCTTGIGGVCGPLSALTGTESFSVIVRTDPGAELVNYALGAGTSVAVEIVLSVSPTITDGSYSFTVTIHS